jgi:hypothetical protein
VLSFEGAIHEGTTFQTNNKQALQPNAQFSMHEL